MAELTRLLKRAACGDSEASRELVPLVYGELKAMARARLASEGNQQTLVPTALVHEAWIQIGGEANNWNNRAHFFSAAALAMRRICVDHARRRLAAKRGGGWHREGLTVQLADDALTPELIVALDEALDRLDETNARAAQLVVLRYFSGFTVAECATLLNTSERSIYREFAAARAWLGAEMA